MTKKYFILFYFILFFLFFSFLFFFSHLHDFHKIIFFDIIFILFISNILFYLYSISFNVENSKIRNFFLSFLCSFISTFCFLVTLFKIYLLFLCHFHIEKIIYVLFHKLKRA